MTNYVRCVNNQTLFINDAAVTYAPHLIPGRVYKVAPPEKNDGDYLRIIDGSGEDYLYPADYFEPFTPDETTALESVTVHLNAYMKGILYAEATAVGKPVSALIRQWIDERLDLSSAS